MRKPNTEAENKRRAEQLRSDLLPACPRCGDLCPVGSTWCAECGVRLVERGSNRYRWYSWS